MRKSQSLKSLTQKNNKETDQKKCAKCAKSVTAKTNNGEWLKANGEWE